MEKESYIDLTKLLQHGYGRSVLLHPDVDAMLTAKYGLSDASIFHGVIAMSLESFIRSFLFANEWFGDQPVHSFGAMDVKTVDDRDLTEILHVHQTPEAYIVMLPNAEDLPPGYEEQRVIQEASLIYAQI